MLGAKPRPVIETDGRAIVLDLSAGSSSLELPPAGFDVHSLGAAIDNRMQAANTDFAFGRWGERRGLYTSAQFATEDPLLQRDIHLGIDVFCAAGTPVCAPLPGRVEAIANNARELDYGPVVILAHGEGADAFYTLYGHLDPECLNELAFGDTVEAGDRFTAVGAPPTNGNWPPHLHFQVIRDLLGLGTEFPGVAARKDADRWLSLSPLPADFFPELPSAALDGLDRTG